jgi:hypothetical protein
LRWALCCVFQPCGPSSSSLSPDLLEAVIFPLVRIEIRSWLGHWQLWRSLAPWGCWNSKWSACLLGCLRLLPLHGLEGSRPVLVGLLCPPFCLRPLCTLFCPGCVGSATSRASARYPLMSGAQVLSFSSSRPVGLCATSWAKGVLPAEPLCVAPLPALIALYGLQCR